VHLVHAPPNVVEPSHLYANGCRREGPKAASSASIFPRALRRNAIHVLLRLDADRNFKKAKDWYGCLAKDKIGKDDHIDNTRNHEATVRRLHGKREGEGNSASEDTEPHHKHAATADAVRTLKLAHLETVHQRCEGQDGSPPRHYAHDQRPKDKAPLDLID